MVAVTNGVINVYEHHSCGVGDSVLFFDLILYINGILVICSARCSFDGWWQKKQYQA